MTKDMTSGRITPLLINFTIPLVLGNLFQLTYNAADSIIVGKFVGEDALAAVGTANPLMTLAILFINGICLGAGILVSTAFGAGDTELVERQVSPTAIAGTVFSLAFSLLCILLANPLLRLLQVPAEILPIAVNYLRIVFAGLLFTFFYNFLAATLRALGDSKSALYFLMISAVLATTPGRIWKERPDTAAPSSFISSRNISLSNRMPSPIPNTRLTSSKISVSQKITSAMCFLPMPRMFSRPNSFLRRFIRKLLV